MFSSYHREVGLFLHTLESRSTRLSTMAGALRASKSAKKGAIAAVNPPAVQFQPAIRVIACSAATCLFSGQRRDLCRVILLRRLVAVVDLVQRRYVADHRVVGRELLVLRL